MRLFRQNKNLTIDVPNDKPAEVVRQRSLRKGIFSQARISVLVFALVVLIGVGATVGYLTYTANQTPNRSGVGDVAIRIVENGTEYDSGTNTVTGTATGKQVSVKSNTATNRVSEVVRITFVPEIEYKYDGDVIGNTLLDEEWSVPVEYESGKYCIDAGLLRLYLADDWSNNFIYKNGSFVYKKVLASGEQTPTLLQGVVWTGTEAEREQYGSVKVNVVADAVQSTPSDAAASWGVVVDESGNVKASS